jgi:hypothetical protein
VCVCGTTGPTSIFGVVRKAAALEGMENAGYQDLKKNLFFLPFFFLGHSELVENNYKRTKQRTLCQSGLISNNFDLDQAQVSC